MNTDYHAKFYAYDLTLRHAANGIERLTQSLFDASVDLNPHQIEAALFALKNPLNKGVILADEVGLGKTIEAALVLSQYWAERKRHLLIVCPASLRKQWATELYEKFNLPSQILDAKTIKFQKKEGVYNPLKQKKAIILSYHFAAKLEEQLISIPWDLVVIDEAHKLRNAHRPKNRMGQALKRALNGRKKLLLTATPLQNSLIEIYGLSTVIDEHLFGDDKAFRKQYMSSKSDLLELKERLEGFIHRTLRKNVLEYVPYTERRTITQPFTPTNQEQQLYDSITNFLSRGESWALPAQQRHLTSLILRKLLASSSYAVINTLEVINKRLISLRDDKNHEDYLIDDPIDGDYFNDEEFSIFLDEEDQRDRVTENTKKKDLRAIQSEIDEITFFIDQAKAINTDSKADALLKALNLGFEKMEQMGAQRKTIIFTESRRTQEYLHKFLTFNGYANKVVSFSGTNSSDETKKIFENWRLKNEGSDRVTGSTPVDKRTALIDYFEKNAEIMIATEAAAEGVNLQFCSSLINYDLPWNPQRLEQRIGRCHRYGQKHDVVVINFLNKRNHVDRRVLELLSEKFNLFDGVFGASDEILGKLESGIDFEKRILQIYETCRQPQEIEIAFTNLQKELEVDIKEKIDETRDLLLQNFDEEIHDLLKLKLAEAEKRIDKTSKIFWNLTKHQLSRYAYFDDKNLRFVLANVPKNITSEECQLGNYELIQKGREPSNNHHVYRMNHSLGEYVISKAKALNLNPAKLEFNYTNHPTKVSVIKQLLGKTGILVLNKLTVESFQNEEYLIFTALTDDGDLVDQEACEKLFNIDAEITNNKLHINKETKAKLQNLQQRQLSAKISDVIETNRTHFQEERERLEKWADEKIFSAELSLTETKLEREALKRESRLSQTVEDQKSIQIQLKKLELRQREQRAKVFEIEDEIMHKRDELIDKLEKNMQETIIEENLFTIEWAVV